MARVRIVLADDHTLVRAGIRALVERLPGVEVLAEASDGRQALKLVETHSPDVVLMDVTMPGLNGLEATSRIAREAPGTKVIVVSVHADPESVLEAIDAGASGYVLKDAGVAELELALDAVMHGGTFLSPSISRHVIDDYRRRLKASGSNGGGAPGSSPDKVELARLTPRQREILQLLAEGASPRRIARTLGLSIKTVETHRAQLMERLGIHDLAGLVRFAIRAGLVRLD